MSIALTYFDVRSFRYCFPTSRGKSSAAWGIHSRPGLTLDRLRPYRFLIRTLLLPVPSIFTGSVPSQRVHAWWTRSAGRSRVPATTGIELNAAQSKGDKKCLIQPLRLGMFRRYINCW